MKKELEESDDEEEKIPVSMETKKDPNLYDMPKPHPVTPCYDNGKLVNSSCGVPENWRSYTQAVEV